MRKIVHSNFEIDLSNLNLSETEQNHWFSDAIFSKITLPFDIYLSDETAALFGYLNEHQISDVETIFDVIYVHYDEMTKAILEIEEVEGDVASCTLRYGFDEFPNFPKKLSELPLEVLDVPNIYTHAKSIINQSYPNVNYNFPQIHVDKIENPQDDDIWFAFENILNNYKDGEFLENEVDEVEEITYNRNIIQPLPYLLHVLKVGFEEQGFTIGGTFVSNPLVKKMLLYSDLEYYKSYVFESIDLSILPEQDELVTDQEEYTYTNYQPWYSLWRKYVKTVAVPHKGKYRIVGDIIIGRAFGISNQPQTKCEIYYNGNLVFSETYLPTTYNTVYNVMHRTVHVNLELDINDASLTDEISIVVSTTDRNFLYYEEMLPDAGIYGKTVSDCSIEPIFLYDESGEIITSILNENKVDLPRAVPDMTFGDLITCLKNWFNLDFVPDNNIININFVEDNINHSNAFDLRDFEVPKPKIAFQKGMSFVLQFQEVESEEYKFLPVYHSHNSIANEGFLKDDKTNEITINALPLPLVFRKDVLTAHGFVQDSSKPMFVIYSGLVNGLNLTQNSTELLLPNIHSLYWQKWFDFRIRATAYTWTFKAFYEQLIGLKKKAFAYGSYLLIKNVNKTEISPDEFEIEIEAESLK
jgi:hypothetical protein